MSLGTGEEVEARVQLMLTLSLPRDELSIPVARHVCSTALTDVGAEASDVDDIEVAVTEACTNVLDHSGPGDDYEVTFEVNSEACVIRVVDAGHGFDSTSLGYDTDLSSERGRGIQLMRALVDKVHFASKDEKGTIVHLEKRLQFRDGSPMDRSRSKRS